jgi:acetoacetyl-CoA synthetase
MHSPLWSPSVKFIEESNLQHYIRWLNKNKNKSFAGYEELWEWSVENISAFWESIWEYFNILHDGKYSSVLSGHTMPGCTWFEGTSLNYSEHIFRNKTAQHPAIIYKSESGAITEISWHELEVQTAAVRHYLEACGVKAGDRVAAFIPCTPEATVAFMATN